MEYLKLTKKLKIEYLKLIHSFLQPWKNTLHETDFSETWWFPKKTAASVDFYEIFRWKYLTENCYTSADLNAAYNWSLA